MTWVDDRRWDADRGRALSELLVSVYPDQDRMHDLILRLGLSLGIMPPATTVGVQWWQLTLNLHAAGALRQAAALLVQQRPALAERVGELLNDDDPILDGNPADPYDVRILPGRRPLIDRHYLRVTLRDFITNRMPVFIVRGGARTGKSYSFQLVLHVLGGAPDVLVVHIDFSQSLSGNSAADLMTKLRRRLGLPRLEATAATTTAVRSAADLVDDLVGDYRFADNKRRIVVIDGLNRADLQPDVSTLAAMLITEVMHNQLGTTQLVLTGFDGDTDPAAGGLIMSENVASITEFEIRNFFLDLVLDRKLTSIELDELVAGSWDSDCDIEELNQRVRAKVLHLLEPAGGGR
jgi:hypothetical protein